MCDIIWNDYIRNVNYPKHSNCYDQSEIHCLVRMNDGEIWNAYWLTGLDYHGESFTGWKFTSFWGEGFIWEYEESDWAGRKVVAFAYMDKL